MSKNKSKKPNQSAIRIRAAELGFRFYDGTPCRTCGGTNRYVMTGRCVPCERRTCRARQDKIRQAVVARLQVHAQGEN